MIYVRYFTFSHHTRLVHEALRSNYLSASAKLKTLATYLELRSTIDTAEALSISVQAVRKRLNELGLTLPPQLSYSFEDVNDMDEVRSLRARLKRQAKAETIESAKMLLATIEACQQTRSLKAASYKLGVRGPQIKRRLEKLAIPLLPPGIPGVIPDSPYVAKIKARLQAVIRGTSTKLPVVKDNLLIG